MAVTLILLLHRNTILRFLFCSIPWHHDLQLVTEATHEFNVLDSDMAIMRLWQ